MEFSIMNMLIVAVCLCNMAYKRYFKAVKFIILERKIKTTLPKVFHVVTQFQFELTVQSFTRGCQTLSLML